MFSPTAGMFSPDDLDMLERVLSRTSRAGSPPAERENVAARAVALFMSGVVTEDALAAELKARTDRTRLAAN